MESYKNRMSITEIRSMSRGEKVRTMELLWDEVLDMRRDPAWIKECLAG